MIDTMRRTRVFGLLAVAAALAASTAYASTPLPTRAQGNGNEPTAGGGVMPGGRFAAHYALAALDSSFDQIELFLFPKKVACSDVAFTSPPYVAVTVDTHGASMRVGRPSLQNGQAFVQADFHPAKSSKYYAIQPGASITFTHVDPKRNSVWHGRVTVEKQQFEGRTFSYNGTFAAPWCGRD